jgi:hypothetical protein
MVKKPSAAELVADLQGADVIIAVWPNGGRDILAGKDVLEGIVESGESEDVRMVTLPVGSTDEAEVILGALGVIQDGVMGEPQIETFQRLLDHVRNRH